MQSLQGYAEFAKLVMQSLQRELQHNVVDFFCFYDISKCVLEEDGLSSFGGNAKKSHMFVFGLTVLCYPAHPRLIRPSFCLSVCP